MNFGLAPVEEAFRDEVRAFLVDWADVIGTLTLLAMPFVKSRRWAVGLLAVIVAHFAVTTIFAPWTFV